MTKRTKKSVGTRKRKKRANYRKKTLRNKKYRKTMHGRGLCGSKDINCNTSGIRNLNINTEQNALNEGQNAITAIEEAEEAEDIDVCPICYEAFTDTTNGPVLHTICGHKFHNNCLSEWCDTANSCPICREEFEIECEFLNIIKKLEEEPEKSRYIFELITTFIENGLDDKTPISENTENFLRYAIKSMLTNPNFDINSISMINLFNLAQTSKDPEIIDLVRTTIINSASENIHDKFKVALIIRDQEMIDSIMGRSSFNPTIALYEILDQDDAFSKAIKEKLLADSSINPNENIHGQTLFAHAIGKKDEQVANALLQNPLLQKVLSSDDLIKIKTFVDSDSKAKGLFEKILKKIKLKDNKPKFPKINFKPTTFNLLMGGK